MKLYTTKELQEETGLSSQCLLDRSRALKMNFRKISNKAYFTEKQRLQIINFRNRKDKVMNVEVSTGHDVKVIHHTTTWWIIESKINYL
jgi:hypothetical protein